MAQFYTVAYRQQAEKEFGARQAGQVASRAAAAARRQLLARSIASSPAFAHIAEHFREDAEKPAHGVFLPQYQRADALTALLLRALANSGTEPMLSKSDSDDWAVLVQTWFGSAQPIGYRGAGAERRELSHLVIVAELNGDLVTAYPVDCYRMPGNRV